MDIDDPDDRRLADLLKVRRSETFWAAQRGRVNGRLDAAAGRAGLRAWVLVPSAVAAAVVGLVLARQPWRTAPAPGPEPGLLEHLDMLEDMDVLESLTKENLG
jgi:hypothetical protein